MIHFRPFQKFISAATFLLSLSGYLSPASAIISEEVNANQSLKTISEKYQASNDIGNGHIVFGSYTNTKQFIFDGATSKFDTLIFERKAKKLEEYIESDSAVRVDSTLLDIKNFKGVVVLRGLAFNLNKPKAVLISGVSAPASNGGLIIEDCFLYADSLDGSFINWMATSTNTIEIRRCFFVSKSGTVVSKISLSAKKVLIENNLFNFPGTVYISPWEKTEIQSNTFNRTQLRLTTDDTNIGVPTFSFTRNLIAHHGSSSAFGPVDFSFSYMTGLNQTDAVQQNNKIYKTWKGFEINNLTNFESTLTNKIVDTIAGKPEKELWDWYTSELDTTIGFAFGKNRAKDKFNILPGRKVNSASFTIQGLSATAWFQPALFPRVFKLEHSTSPLAPLAANPDLRFFAPGLGSLHFGSFRIDSISLAKQSRDGTPVLLANDTLGVFKRQPPIPSNLNSQPSIFSNSLPTARSFYLAYLGNTRSGASVSPSEGLSINDSLTFKKVDSAGFTTIFVDNNSPLQINNLRFLNRSIHFSTTAVLSDSIIFGSSDSVGAFRSDSIYWVVGVGGRNQLVPAKKTKGLPAKYYAQAPVENPFYAVMVEKLSVPKGGTTFTLADGTLKAESINGYQLSYNDTLAPIDTLHYGQFSKVYAFKSQGQGVGDTLFLNLNSTSDQEAFKDSAGAVLPVASVLDQSGIRHIKLLRSDTSKGFYLAVRYNVFANILFDGPLNEGVTVTGLMSSKSAVVKFTNLPNSDSIRELPLANRDSAFASTRFLAGKELQRNGAILTRPWGMTFEAAGASDRTKVETWISNGVGWTRLSAPVPDFVTTTGNEIRILNLPVDAKTIMVVERLSPPETYVDSTVKITQDNLQVTVNYKGGSPSKAITRYCLEVKTVDQFGVAENLGCEEKDIGVTASIKLPATGPYVYRIQYFTAPGIRYGNPDFQAAIGGPTWDRTVVLQEGLTNKVENQWVLIGFPFSGELKKSLVAHDTSSAAAKRLKDSAIVDTITFMNVKRVAGKSSLEIVNRWQANSFTAGDGFLVGGTRKFDIRMDPSYQFLPLKPYRMALDSGWHFVANPFPTTLSIQKIESLKRKSALKFWQLQSSATPTGWNYAWIKADTLFPLRGYAYFAREKDTLAFNLLTELGTLPKASGREDYLKVNLESSWASSQMYFMAQKGEGNIPFLNSPSSSLEMRVGGGSGYLLKNLEDLEAIDEQVEIRSSSSGHATFTVGRSITALAKGLCLIDLGSGQIYNEKSASELPIKAGSHSYRLLVGSPAFIEEKVSAYMAGSPRSIGLSQNSPNPARGITRINLDWPAVKSEGRRAILQILDTRGREVDRYEISDIQVGRQVLNLDVSKWRPGIYLYRLTVFADGSISRLQKRMLVSP